MLGILLISSTDMLHMLAVMKNWEILLPAFIMSITVISLMLMREAYGMARPSLPPNIP